MLLQLGAGRPLDQTATQLVDQPVRVGHCSGPGTPRAAHRSAHPDLHLAHHGPPSGPSDGIAPTAATPRSSRPRRDEPVRYTESAHRHVCAAIDPEPDGNRYRMITTRLQTTACRRAN